MNFNKYAEKGGKILALNSTSINTSIKQTPIGAKARNTMYKGAFIAVMRNGHVGIFRRREIKSTPIKEKLNKFCFYISCNIKME